MPASQLKEMPLSLFTNSLKFPEICIKTNLKAIFESRPKTFQVITRYVEISQ
jgi:hypothetical protein